MVGRKQQCTKYVCRHTECYDVGTRNNKRGAYSHMKDRAKHERRPHPCEPAADCEKCERKRIKSTQVSLRSEEGLLAHEADREAHTRGDSCLGCAKIGIKQLESTGQYQQNNTTQCLSFVSPDNASNVHHILSGILQLRHNIAVSDAADLRNFISPHCPTTGWVALRLPDTDTATCVISMEEYNGIRSLTEIIDMEDGDERSTPYDGILCYWMHLIIH